MKDNFLIDATVDAAGRIVPKTELAAMNYYYAAFCGCPGNGGWSLILRSADDGAFVEQIAPEALRRKDGGLELQFSSKASGRRYAVVLTVTDGAVTAVTIEYRMRPELQGCVAAGARFNEQAGYWEYGGLRDITDEQVGYSYARWVKGINLDSAYYGDKTLRFNFAPLVGCHTITGSAYAAFYNASNLEVATVTSPTNAVYSFVCNCSKLKSVHGFLREGLLPDDSIDVHMVSGNFALDAFTNCSSLTYVKLHGVALSFDFGWSPLLGMDCVEYMIANAANTTAITLTFHPKVYAQISDSLKASAAAKNITLAVA